MKKIEDTTGGIIDDVYSGPIARITRLAGIVGDEPIKLYISNPEFKSLPIELRPYLGLNFTISKNNNQVKISSTNPLTILQKKDHLKILFVNGDISMLNCLVGSTALGGVKINFASLSDTQLLYMIDNQLFKIEVFNSRLGIYQSFDFCSIPNIQYTTEDEGKELLQIVIKRLAGLKLQLKNKNSY